MFDQHVIRDSSSDKIRVVDLFSGAGGFSLAARQAGCEVVFAVENDRHAASTYRNNFKDPTPELYEKSILDLEPSEVGRKHFLKTGACDLMLGGPPCQGFSSHRLNDSGVDDPRNDLLQHYFRFVKHIGPKVFLMENVPGLLWERHKSHLELLYSEGDAAGYFMFEPVVLDAKDFGVPQSRKRVFILGVKGSTAPEGFQWPPKPTHGPKAGQTGDEIVPDWISCRDCFKRAPKKDINNTHMKSGAVLVEVFKNTPKNGGSRLDSGRTLPCHEKHKGHKDVYGRIDPRKPAPTMTAGCSNPSKGRFVHPTQHHGITMRQAARIQSFPDDFEFLGGLSAAGRQIGNAVPVRLGKVLIEHLFPLLLESPMFYSECFIEQQGPISD